MPYPDTARGAADHAGRTDVDDERFMDCSPRVLHTILASGTGYFAHRARPHGVPMISSNRSSAFACRI
jgi:hypothetical protein